MFQIYRKVVLFAFVWLFIPWQIFAQSAKQKELDGYTQALKQYRKICAADSNNYAAFNNSGNIYFLQGRLDSAEIAYLQAERILRRLEMHYQSSDTTELRKIQKHHAGVLLNLGTFYTAAGPEEKAFEYYGMVIKNVADVRKAKELLGLPFEEINQGLAKKPDISRAKVEYMISETAQKNRDNKKTSGSKSSKQQQGKQKGKTAGRKGDLFDGKVSDVFYWIY